MGFDVTSYAARKRNVLEEKQKTPERRNNGFDVTSYVANKKQEEARSTLLGIAHNLGAANQKVSQQRTGSTAVMAGNETVYLPYSAGRAGFSDVKDAYRQEAQNRADYSSEEYQGYLKQIEDALSEQQRRNSIDPTEAAYQLDQLRQQSAALDAQLQPLDAVQAGSKPYGNELWDARQREKDRVDAAIKQLEDDLASVEKNRQLLNYGRYVQAEDFEQGSQYNPNQYDESNTQTIAIAPGEGGLSGGAYTLGNGGDELYEYVNGNPDVIEKRQESMRALGADPNTADAFMVAGQMSDEEKAIFNYIFNTQGADKAHEYFDLLTPDLNYRYNVAQKERYAQLAQESPGFASVYSTLVSPDKMITLGTQIQEMLENGETDQNAPYNKYSNIPTTIRGEVSRMVEDKWGKVGSFAYQTGMSILDNIYQMAITGGAEGEAFMLTIMGTGAAADGVIAAKERGLSDDQAFVLGLVSGAVEAITEKIGLDELYGGIKAGRPALTAMLRSTLAEGSEEIASTVLDDIADMIIAGVDSERIQLINQLMEQGYSQDQAVGMAFADLAKEAGVSGLAGALSGLFMSGAAQTLMKTYDAVDSHKSKKTAEKQLEEARNTVPGLMTGSEYAATPAEAPSAVEGTSMPTQKAVDTTETENAAQPVLEPQTQTETAAPQAEPVVTPEQRAALERDAMAAMRETINKSFGKAGAEAAMNAYDPQSTASVTDYLREYAAIYNAAREGTALPDHTNVLTATQQEAAYKAGIADRTSLQTQAEASTIEVTPAKQAQYDALQAAGVQSDDFEVITAPEQIMTYQEAVRAATADNQKGMADFDMQDAAEALDAGEITVYSAGPIRTGSFVTPSRMIAESMAQGQRISSMTVPLDSVAWTDATGGQYVEMEDMNNGGEGNGILSGDGNRARSARAGEQTRGMESRTGESESRNGDGRVSEEAEGGRGENARSIAEPQKVSSAQLGVPGGIDSDSVVRVTEYTTEADKAAKAKAEKYGYKLVGFKGSSLHVKGVGPVRACIVNGSTVYARLDHPEFTGEQLIDHEHTHPLIKNGTISLDSVRSGLLEHWSEDALSDIIDGYAAEYPGMTPEEAFVEIVCDAQGGMNIFAADGGAKARVFQTFLDDVKAATDSQLTEKNAVKTPADIPNAPVSVTEEVAYSRQFDREYMDKARAVNENTHNVKQSVLDKAAQDREYVKNELEKITDYLPPDVEGNTFYSDSSYGGSEENSTVCPRSLAYEEFMDTVAEELDHPLTVEDTVFISQDAMSLTDKPECLYCYVAMDRKAYREYLGRYIEQRDAFLKDVNSGMDLGLVAPVKKQKGVKRTIAKDTAYGKFLDGRDNTPNMYKRVQLWMSDGPKITKADLASEARMNRALSNPALRAQVEDARAYAQAASWQKKKNPYSAYNNHILKWSKQKVNKLNKQYGLRFYSFSDFSAAFILENMQQITDASVKGLKGLGYNKELDFVRIFASTGINCNVSVYGYNDGHGGVAMDAMQGADWEEAKALRAKYPNVGCTFVATNDAQVDWALNQDWIDVVIPFHIVRTGANVASMFGWTNYTDMSEDRKNPNWHKGNKRHIFPSEHQNDKATYLRLCEENNLTPRFEKWVNHPNYMKLVNETRQSEAETKPLQPVFTLYDENGNSLIQKSINEFIARGGYMQHLGGTVENMRTLAAETADKIRAGESRKGIQFSRESKPTAEDNEYLAAVRAGDTAAADRIIEATARANGYTERVYHGTDSFGFTVLDPTAGDDGISFFATDDLSTAESYTRANNTHRVNDMPATITAGNYQYKDLRFDTQEDLDAFKQKHPDYVTEQELAEIEKDGGDEDMSLYKARRQAQEEYKYYEADHSRRTTIREMMDNPDKYGLNDLLHAIYAWDPEAETESFLEQIRDGDSVSDAIVDFGEMLAMEAEEMDVDLDEYLDITFSARAPVGETYTPKQAGIYDFFANTSNMYELDAGGKLWSDILFEGEKRTTRQISQAIHDRGQYDGVKIKNVYDIGIYGEHRSNRAPATIYIFFHPESQVKSADTVTYDDQGNIIPPSERYNPTNNDIRWSRESSPISSEALEEQNEQLKKDLEDLTAQLEKAQKQAAYWEGQTKRSTKATPDPKDINRLANVLIHSEQTKLKAADIAPDLTELAEYIMATDEQRGHELAYTEVKDKALSIAQYILSNYEELVDSDSVRQYKRIRKYIRDYGKISVPGDDLPPDFKDWKAHNRWLRVGVDNGGVDIDMIYKDLSETWPWFFPPDTNYGSDQLYAIAEGVRRAEPAYWNPNDQIMAGATEYLANKIVDGLINGYVDRMGKIVETPIRQAKTYADKMEKKLSDQKYDAAQKLDAQKAKDQARLDALRAEKNARIRQEHERAQYDLAYAVHQARVKADEQMANLKAHYAEMKQNERQRKMESNMRTRLLKIAKRLADKKLPTPSRALVNEYIGQLDLVAKNMTGKTRDALQALSEMYNDALENNPDFVKDEAIDKKLARLNSVKIGDLTIEQVQDLTDVLLAMEHQFNNEKRELDSADRRDVYQKGLQIISDVEGGRTVKPQLMEKLDNLFVRNTLSPLRELHRVTGYVDGDPLYDAAQRLNRGQLRMNDYVMNSSKAFDQWVQDAKLMESLTGKKAKTIKIRGAGMDGNPVTVEITPDMRISLYLHNKNLQNQRHIGSISGGIKVPDMKLYRAGKIAEAYAKGTRIRLQPSEVSAICANMSPQERALAERIYKYFNTTSREALSDVHERLKGYPMRFVEDYFPIDTDGNFTKAAAENIAFDGSLEGSGWLKERVVNAKNPIMLYDATSVLLKSIQAHGQFVGLAIPIRDFNKLYAMSGPKYDESGERVGTVSVKETVRRLWGTGASEYIDKMLGDLQSTHTESNSWTDLLRKIRSNYAGATLVLNLSVAMKQAGSYPTAAAVLGWKPLAAALKDFGRVDLDYIASMTPLQWLRSQGYSTPELGDLKAKGKQLPKALNWIQGMDLATTRKLWKACEYYMEYNHPEMKKGSAEYRATISEIYNRVIEETQPNYTTMQRPQLLRSNNELLRDVSMFKTQLFQNFNILYDAFGNMAAKRTQYQANPTEETKAKYDEATKAAGRAASSQIVQAVVIAAVTLAWNAMRGKMKRYKDDDKDRITGASFAKRFGLDVASGFFGMVPFGSEVFSAISSKLTGEKWYGLEGVSTGALTDFASTLMTAVDQIGKSLEASQSGSMAAVQKQVLAWENIAESSAKIFGVPASNVMGIIKAVYGNITKTACGKYYGEYLSMLATTPIEGHKNEYYQLLYNAEKNGNYDQFYQIYDSLVELDAMASATKSTAENIDAALKRLEKAG